ncbi:transposase [Ventosimonas gracilis]|uniref:transposase n=1 Tax=Ventosimonas gracilis TaxID=1680762 RepID=UPI0034E00290
MVNSLNGVLATAAQENTQASEKKRWGNTLWSPSYFAGSCGGTSINIIRQFIEQQKNTTLNRYAARTAAPSALSIHALKRVSQKGQRTHFYSGFKFLTT